METTTRRKRNRNTNGNTKTGTETPRDRLMKLRDELRGRVSEREEVIDGILCALIAQHHVMLVSPPGSAKSMLARLMCDSFTDTTFFQWLMTKYTEPNEVFGPIDLQEWANKGNYTRLMNGYFPTCHVAFLDEIYKSNSAVLNTFLTAINEKEFHDRGQIHKIPLRMVIAASNELPPDGSELEALHDRFMLRYQVAYVRDPDNFTSMLRSRHKANRGKPMPKLLSLADLDALNAEVVALSDSTPSDVEEALFNLRSVLASEGVEVSDRRWVNAQEILAAWAYLNGDTVIDALHFDILKHCLWRDEREFQKIASIVTKVSSPALADATEIFDAIMEQVTGLPATGDIKSEAGAVISEVKKGIKALERKKEEASDAVGQRIDSFTDLLRTEHGKIQTRVIAEMGLGDDE